MHLFNLPTFFNFSMYSTSHSSLFRVCKKVKHDWLLPQLFLFARFRSLDFTIIETTTKRMLNIMNKRVNLFFIFCSNRWSWPTSDASLTLLSSKPSTKVFFFASFDIFSGLVYEYDIISRYIVVWLLIVHCSNFLVNVMLLNWTKKSKCIATVEKDENGKKSTISRYNSKLSSFIWIWYDYIVFIQTPFLRLDYAVWRNCFNLRAVKPFLPFYDWNFICFEVDWGETESKKK